MIFKKCLLLLSFMALIMSCNASDRYEGLSVKLTINKEESSTVTVTFINESDEEISLSNYIFCNADMLYIDLFEIQKGSKVNKNDIGYYGGLADFVTSEMLKDGEKFKLSAKEQKSCNVKLPMFYSFYEGGEFDVTYVLHQNLFDIKSPKILSSNTITVKFNPTRSIKQ